MLAGLAGTILEVIRWLVIVATLYSFVHAAIQRPDAYTAAEKLTKPVWLVILGVAGLLAVVGVLDVMGVAIAAVASGVYLVDVRPKLLDVQGKSR
ncbi:DUF2516 family protein [Mycobacterium sp. NBC_00419]|uniref:DUF2516 family protein n=1 Tax=Mycobacterium sp. NBC_00419 TaxID=2975989 RepID=UPI002E21D6C8